MVIKSKPRLKVNKVYLDHELPQIEPNFPQMPILYLELLENKDKIKPELRNSDFVSSKVQKSPMDLPPVISNAVIEKTDEIPGGSKDFIMSSDRKSLHAKKNTRPKIEIKKSTVIDFESPTNDNDKDKKSTKSSSKISDEIDKNYKNQMDLIDSENRSNYLDKDYSPIRSKEYFDEFRLNNDTKNNQSKESDHRKYSDHESSNHHSRKRDSRERDSSRDDSSRRHESSRKRNESRKRRDSRRHDSSRRHHTSRRSRRRHESSRRRDSRRQHESRKHTKDEIEIVDESKIPFQSEASKKLADLLRTSKPNSPSSNYVINDPLLQPKNPELIGDNLNHIDSIGIDNHQGNSSTTEYEVHSQQYTTLPPALSSITDGTVDPVIYKKQAAHAANAIHISKITANEEEEEEKRQLLYKFEKIKRSYKGAKIPEFNDYTDLKHLKQMYNDVLRTVTLDATMTDYRQYLCYGFFAMEFIFGKIFKTDISGFAANQIASLDTTNSYDALLIELGEKSYMSGFSTLPVEVRLLGVLVVNAAMFIAMKKVSNSFNIGDLLGATGKKNTSSENNTNKKPKMSGPGSLDDLDDLLNDDDILSKKNE